MTRTLIIKFSRHLWRNLRLKDKGGGAAAHRGVEFDRLPRIISSPPEVVLAPCAAAKLRQTLA